MCLCVQVLLCAGRWQVQSLNVALTCVPNSLRVQYAGFKVEIGERKYFPRVDDHELSFVLFRSQEIR